MLTLEKFKNKATAHLEKNLTVPGQGGADHKLGFLFRCTPSPTSPVAHEILPRVLFLSIETPESRAGSPAWPTLFVLETVWPGCVHCWTKVSSGAIESCEQNEPSTSSNDEQLRKLKSLKWQKKINKILW